MSIEALKIIETDINKQWEVVKNNKLFTMVRNGELNQSVYELLMTQIYHYTKYNSVNQAAAAYATSPEKTSLLKFMYKHALEELGHESMALKDLKSVGADADNLVKIGLLPATNALIGYLHSVAINQGGVARLGYSLWAEQCYDHIEEILNAFRSDLNLEDKNMTFFVAHSNIDAKHAEEVQEAITKWVNTDEEIKEVRQVAITTLYLTSCLMDSVVDACSK